MAFANIYWVLRFGVKLSRDKSHRKMFKQTAQMYYLLINKDNWVESYSDRLEFGRNETVRGLIAAIKKLSLKIK